jgi:hypothetical protein
MAGTIKEEAIEDCRTQSELLHAPLEKVLLYTREQIHEANGS